MEAAAVFFFLRLRLGFGLFLGDLEEVKLVLHCFFDDFLLDFVFFFEGVGEKLEVFLHVFLELLEGVFLLGFGCLGLLGLVLFGVFGGVVGEKFLLGQGEFLEFLFLGEGFHGYVVFFEGGVSDFYAVF